MIWNIKSSINLFLNNSGLIFTDLYGQIVAILTKKIIADRRMILMIDAQ